MTAEATTVTEFPAEGQYNPECGINCYIYRGIPYPANSSAALGEAVEDFPLEPGDVTVVGFPKSGTNWLQVMVGKLYDDDWGTLKITGGVVPHLETASRPGYEGYERSIVAQTPRLMKAHSPYQHMPKLFREKGVSKVLYVARNGKDVCDSYFNQLDSMRDYLGLTLDWPAFLENFIAGRVPFGSWLDHVCEWRRYGETEGVLHLDFESMRGDVRATLEKVVAFLGRPIRPGKIDEVIEVTEFSRMQEGDMARLYNGEVARRAGKVGGWRKHFTVEQNELFDAKVTSVIEERGIIFDYG